MKCEICHNGPPDGPTLYRVNPLGEVGIWRCDQHLTPDQRAALDPETVRLTKIIDGTERQGD